MSFADIGILLLVLASLVGAGVFLWKKRHGCGSCSGCPEAERCQKKNKK